MINKAKHSNFIYNYNKYDISLFVTHHTKHAITYCVIDGYCHKYNVVMVFEEGMNVLLCLQVPKNNKVNK